LKELNIGARTTRREKESEWNYLLASGTYFHGFVLLHRDPRQKLPKSFIDKNLEKKIRRIRK